MGRRGRKYCLRRRVEGNIVLGGGWKEIFYGEDRGKKYYFKRRGKVNIV